MDKFFVKSFWHSLRILINKSNVVLLVITVIISFLIFKIAEISNQQGTFLTLSNESWLSVTASMFAATLFLLLQSFINLINSSEENTYQRKYNEFVETYKLKNIYNQRGSTEIVDKYKKLIENAKKRVWAIGMTNRHLLEQHNEKIKQNLLNKNIDIVIAFWNPTSKINSKINGEYAEFNMLDIQHLLESSHVGDTDWEQQINNRQRNFKNHINLLQNIKGEIRIVNLSHATNFSCFLIDDDLFFFPFLSGPESTDDPIIQCAINDGIGARIYEHFNKILNGDYLRDDNNNIVMEIVYHRRANENIIDRL